MLGNFFGGKDSAFSRIFTKVVLKVGSMQNESPLPTGVRETGGERETSKVFSRENKNSFYT